MICVTIKTSTYEHAHQQIIQTCQEADIIELRLDYFNYLDFEEIKKLMQALSKPVIFTLRDGTQGGLYQGTEVNRIKEIRQLASLQPDYFDVESHISSSVIQELFNDYPNIKWILSSHYLDGTPDDLNKIYSEMKKNQAHFYKIAAKATSSLDALKMLDFSNKHSDNNLLLISMGLEGQITRILGPVFKAPFVYACLEEDKDNEFGQISALILKHNYHHHFLSPKSSIFCLIGDPVEQSVSHTTHNQWFQEKGIDAVYLKMKITPAELSEWMNYALTLNFSGASVTMPLKECVKEILDEIDPIAQKIDAVNTLLFRKEKVKGYNTDCIGALNAIEEQSGLVAGKKIVILGAGGAAKAIAYEACKRGAKVVILNRNVEKALQLAKQFGCEGYGLGGIHEISQKGYDILINCTPSSMPIDPQYLLEKAVIMDIVSKPKETCFLKEAIKKGCQVVYGYDMFIKQAQEQHKIWFAK